MLIDRDDRVMNLCEIKFTGGEYELDSEEAAKLRNRIDAVRKDFSYRGNIHLTMITNEGLKKNKYSGMVQSEITLSDLFAPVEN